MKPLLKTLDWDSSRIPSSRKKQIPMKNTMQLFDPIERKRTYVLEFGNDVDKWMFTSIAGDGGKITEFS